MPLGQERAYKRQERLTEFATTTSTKIKYPNPVVHFELLKLTSSPTSSPNSTPLSTSGVPPSTPNGAGVGSTSSTGLLTTITFELQMYTSGKMTNGRTIERTTCDATRRVSIPSRPTETATAMAGTMEMRRVRIRRRKGEVFHSMKPG